MNTEGDILLPQPPEGMCAQTVLMRPGSAGINAALVAITEAGGQVLAMRPLFSESHGRWHLLVVFFVPLGKAGTILGKVEEGA